MVASEGLTWLPTLVNSVYRGWHIMAYTVSKILATGIFFVRDWLFCSESIALFVASLFLFNLLRLLRGLFVCFCRWKYKNVKIPNSPDTVYKDILNCRRSSHDTDDKQDIRNYSHEAKTYDMAAFSIQGRRKTMEDRFNSISHDYEQNHSVYAVFDGHGGEVLV